jgi:hypothetical protein
VSSSVAKLLIGQRVGFDELVIACTLRFDEESAQALKKRIFVASLNNDGEGLEACCTLRWRKSSEQCSSCTVGALKAS